MSADRGRSRRPAASDAPHPLDGLLKDIDDLRLTLAVDLQAAAGAAEAGAADVASDILGADRDEVARFRQLAEMRMGRLQRLAVVEPTAARWRRRLVVALPAVPLVGAMAVSAAAVTGVLPIPGAGGHVPRSAAATQAVHASPVSSSLERLTTVIESRHSSARDVIAAARKLHRQIAALIAETSHDPAQAAEVAELLREEQSLLLRAQPPGAAVVLDATRRLAEQLVNDAPRLPKPAPTDTTLPRPLVTPSPKTKNPSPSASPKKSSAPKPSSSASSAPAPGSNPSQGTGGHIPAVP